MGYQFQPLLFSGFTTVGTNGGGGGTVTAVTATGVLSSSGGTTPNISFTGVLPPANGGTGVANNNSYTLTFTASGSIGGTNTGDITLGVTNGLSLSGQVLSLATFTSSTAGAVPASGGGTTNFLRADGTWAPASNPGTVTSVSVVSANGLAGTVATATTTPTITLSTTVTGVLKGNGTAISAAVSGTDYVIPSGSITGTASNITATSNSTITTLSSLSLPYSQVTGGPTAGANTALSNLASTAVNVDIVPASDNSIALGHPNHAWSVVNSNLLALTNGGPGANVFIAGESGVIDPTGTAQEGAFYTTDDGGIAIFSANQSGSNTSGLIKILTGNQTGTNNSGNILLRIGTSTATRGQLQFQDGSEGTTGYVWTSTDTLGSGHWAPRGSSYTFSDSLVNTSGIVTLVNDSVSPSASQYYGTNASSILGYYNLPSPSTGTVTSVSVTSANGFSGTVATPTSTPAITISTSVTGILYGNGTSVASAVAGNFPTLNQNTTGTASNITATSNSTLTTLSALSLPYSQVTGGPNGTVTSVALSTPGVLYTVSGSPVTSSGTLTLNLINQAANTVFAGPTTGSAAAPTFRALVGADIPVDNNTIYVNGSGQIAVQYSIPNATLTSYFFGSGAGNASFTGADNNGFGQGALTALTSGNTNNAFGSGALASITSGHSNEAFGYQAGNLLTTGADNVAIGNAALSAATTSNYNVAVGQSTLFHTTGGTNTAIGSFALDQNTTGTGNVALGYNTAISATNNVTSTNMTYLGATSGSSPDGLTNSTALGYGASITASNQIMLGNTSVTSIQTGTPQVLYNGASPMTTTGDMEYYNSGVQRFGIGTTGQVLTVASGIPTWQAITASQIAGTGSTAGYGLVSNGPTSAPTWQPLPGVVSAFYASSQITTKSTAITSSSYTTFSNSPALSFTPTITGTYKVYGSFPIYCSTTGDVGNTRIFNTSGGATLLYQSDSTQVGYAGGSLGNGSAVSIYCQSIYTLTAGTAYVFDVQGASPQGANVYLDTTDFMLTGCYMFAELEVGGSTAAFVGSGRSFLTSGTTYTTPVGITSSTRFKFTLIGGGGGGGGINTTSAHGSGGGGGGAAIVELTGLSASTGYTVAIGSAGAGGISTTTAATSGGNTTLTVGATTYTAGGGSPGADTIDTLGGAGGTTTNATIGVTGQDGMASGAATASAPWGRGGDSGMLFGAGGAAIIAAGTGKGGTGYGGGGSGGYGATATGGAGSAGCIIVEWWN
jgi:hypothetical protein